MATVGRHIGRTIGFKPGVRVGGISPSSGSSIQDAILTEDGKMLLTEDGKILITE